MKIKQIGQKSQSLLLKKIMKIRKSEKVLSMKRNQIKIVLLMKRNQVVL